MSERIVLRNVRFSYANVWEPKAIGDKGDPKYSVSIIIPKADKKQLAELKSAVSKVTEEGKSSKWGGKVPRFKNPVVKDGDEERPDDPAYSNSYFINANAPANRPPHIVDKRVNPILDRDEFYSGCYGNASISLFPYSVNGNNGIGAGLEHLQKTKDGERLAGGVSVDDVFKPEDEDDEDYVDGGEEYSF